jgi:hypothetical protein
MNSNKNTPVNAKILGRISPALIRGFFWRFPMGIIYLARNTVNGKGYVGKTVQTMEFRRACHQKDAIANRGYYFHKALRKYGFDAFEWSVLYEDGDNDVLCIMETRMIRRLGTKIPNGYNMTDGGEGIVGMPEESRLRQIESNKTREYSVGTRRKIGISVGKITEDGVLSIRHRYALGETCKAIAKDYEVTPDNVLAIINGKSWAWVGGPIGARRRGPVNGRSYPTISAGQVKRRSSERRSRYGVGFGF